MNENIPDKEFWDLSDTFIQLANNQCDSVRPTKVSAAFLYAAARFNAFIAATQSTGKAEFAAHRDESIAYFVGEFKKMLQENLRDYETNFDKYTGPLEL